METQLIEAAFPFAEKALREKHCDYTDRGIRANLKIWAKHKGELINLMRKSPRWNEDIMSIVIDSKYVPLNGRPAKRESRDRLMRAVFNHLHNANKFTSLSLSAQEHIVNSWKLGDLLISERVDEWGHRESRSSSITTGFNPE